MTFPTELHYTREHEWAKKDGTTATVGITKYACEALGDIVFLDLPAVGKVVKKGDTLGSIESVKAVSDIYSPLSGKVVAVNENAKSSLETVSGDPHGAGWLVKIELTNPSEWENMMPAAAYNEHVKTCH